MNISDCYNMLEVPETATDEEIKKSFKLLAHKYHPDKNPHRVEWANEAMSNLNKAYTTLMKLRFREEKKETYRQNNKPREQQKPYKSHAGEKPRKSRQAYYNPYEQAEYIDPDILTGEFVKIRESAKNELYRYFQYGIYNIARRENISNRNIFDNVTANLKKYYHSIKNLRARTDDSDFRKHFDVFSSMIYNFYMASECINIIDSYSNAIEVEAYRLFKKGDDTLQPCEKEIFYDRHNRGFFKKSIAESLMLKSEINFNNMLTKFPKSTWAIETRIKLQYTLSLKEYLYLFFSEYREN